MNHSTLIAFACRLIVVLLMSMVWFLFFLNARYAYIAVGKVKALRFSLVLGSAAVFYLQIFTMKRLNPEDAHGIRFFLFVLAECAGALAVMFWTLLRERAKMRQD